MYNSHPMGPRNRTITTQPNLEPIGHFAFFCEVQVPLFGEKIIWTIGRMNPKTKKAQDTGITIINNLKSFLKLEKNNGIT